MSDRCPLEEDLSSSVQEVCTSYVRAKFSFRMGVGGVISMAIGQVPTIRGCFREIISLVEADWEGHIMSSALMMADTHFHDFSLLDSHSHHLTKRFVYPGISIEDSFNNLFAPENLPNFAAASFTITVFRTIGEFLPGEIVRLID